jgi:tRNA(Ile2) C34 agmatinyltransferase TiaS
MCEQCEAVRINGVLCHEHGCPDAWKDEKRECKWCGSQFNPEGRNQYFCSEDCAQDYSN